jgi:hypothetical protein
MPTRLAAKPDTVPHHALAGRSVGSALAIVGSTLFIICPSLLQIRQTLRATRYLKKRINLIRVIFNYDTLNHLLPAGAPICSNNRSDACAAGIGRDLALAVEAGA